MNRRSRADHSSWIGTGPRARVGTDWCSTLAIKSSSGIVCAGAGEFRRMSASPRSSSFGKMKPAFSSMSTSKPRRRSHTDRLLPVSRPNEAEFPPAAQTALELLDWTFRGPRAVDRAPNAFGALRPQHNWSKTEDYYEISISREKLATSASWGFPTAVRYARESRGVESSRKKELLAETHGLLRKRR